MNLKLRDFQDNRAALDAIHALATTGASLPTDLLPLLTERGVTTADGTLRAAGQALAAEWGRSLKFQAWRKAARTAFEASQARKAADFEQRYAVK